MGKYLRIKSFLNKKKKKKRTYLRNINIDDTEST